MLFRSIVTEDDDKDHYLTWAKKNLTRFNNIFNNGNEISVDEFISNAFLEREVWGDIFIEYDIYGIYALCHKSDNEGYYSPGNALDICKLLELIKDINEDYFKQEGIYDLLYGEDNDKCYPSINKFFEESWKTNNRITIA